MTDATGLRAIDFFLNLAEGAEKVEITFSGGEPLVALPLLESLTGYAERRARDVGMEASFVLKTNGTRVNKTTIDFFRTHSFNVVVSIDGLRGVHDRYRRTKGGHGTHAAVCANLETLRENDISCVASVTVHPDSASKVREGVTYLHTHGIDQIDIGPAYGTVDWTSKDAASLANSLMEVARYIREVNMRGGNLRVSPLIPESEHVGGYLLDCWGCRAALTNLAFLPNGQITGCSALAMMVNRFPELVLGNVFLGLDEDAVDRMLALSQAPGEARPSCRGCSAAKNCAGGCLAINYPTTGKPLIPPTMYCNTIGAIEPAWQHAWA